ncbi:MAG: DNA-directed RNA polymerase subunit beta [Bacteroides sp.]
MTSSVQKQRVSFARARAQFDYPDFLEVQVESFRSFFRLWTTPEERKNEGLYKVFSETFPIKDSRNSYTLEFLDYYIEPSRYSIEECIERGTTYGVSLKAKLRLSCNDESHVDFKALTQDVFLGSIPDMTSRGTFVINGAERVVVSQLHRSPGVFFAQSVHNNGTKLYSARIIPFKGSWIEFATDINNIMYAYIDRRKKLPVTTLLRAIGFSSDNDILDIYGLAEEVKVSEKTIAKYKGRVIAGRLSQVRREDFVDEDTGELLMIERFETLLDRGVVLDDDNIKIILENQIPSMTLQLEDSKAAEFKIIYDTLEKDTTNNTNEAAKFVYRLMRNSEPPDDQVAHEAIENLFFSSKRYDLGSVGRFKINRKLNLKIDENEHVLTNEDIVQIIKYLIELKNVKANVDDIDHLSNRRVRTVGEQLASYFNVGLQRMARTIRERMNVRDNEVFGPTDLINSKTLTSVINSFFGTNQLSQFMDQTNPLAEMTHKRRLSALGPGGLSRERAGFEVRDVHYTHYGRLCPIETPEGPNIGLISSLCVFARINSMGFIETPYRKVTNGCVDLSESGYSYYSAEDEEKLTIAQANAPLSEDGHFINPQVRSRREGDFPLEEREKIALMDVAPNQIASIAASLIPFLENDDANRALMGSNMMRQAVPLLVPEAPIVGTGLEGPVVQDSRVQVVAEGDGEVVYVDADKIVIRYEQSEEEAFVSFDGAERTYTLPKFLKTNQNTSMTLRPIVTKGQRVKKGELLSDGYATDRGELALGRNLLVAFMPWKGYNFEDAIVINERLVREDYFTSIHVDEYILEVRDTKRGQEELTSDIPNVSEEATKELDEHGMIRIGARVSPGDILIGKITPKGESDPSAEEKLLRAIFGDKAGDVKDASLKAPPSLYGVVIRKHLFSGVNKEGRGGKGYGKLDLERVESEFNREITKYRDQLLEKLTTKLGGRVSQGVSYYTGEVKIAKGQKFTEKNLQNLDYLEVEPFKWVADEEVSQLVGRLILNFVRKYRECDAERQRKVAKIQIGDEMPAGILQMAKVYIAKKRKIRVGDKMAGRHGNKGIVAKIVHDADMPFLPDGTPMDIVLNPLGVPSRMNLGQIYETILGWAGRKLDLKFATPVFDGATLDDISTYTDKAGLPRFGKIQLRDGGTGELFDQYATVGVIYMLKLGHMVDDKMHARSIGPYSLITQQPLGGKAQFGGQRFGEMEVWALEAFGAAHILQEILTVKSDDVDGRARTYEAIVKGDLMPRPGIPESLNVLLHELRGLGLSIKLN